MTDVRKVRGRSLGVTDSGFHRSSVVSGSDVRHVHRDPIFCQTSLYLSSSSSILPYRLSSRSSVTPVLSKEVDEGNVSGDENSSGGYLRFQSLNRVLKTSKIQTFLHFVIYRRSGVRGWDGGGGRSFKFLFFRPKLVVHSFH